MWDLPGGRQVHGESIFQTLQREIFEETGVQIEKAAWRQNEAFVINYLEKEDSISLHHTCLIYDILEFDDSQINSNIHEEDVTGSSWIPKSELTKVPCSKVVLSAFGC